MSSAALGYTASVLVGLVVGSFLNVCIWRLPRRQSVVSPPSSCPSCGSRIKPWDNVPVLSYLILRGKCRSCGVMISPRYPLVEALNGALYALVFWRYGPGWHLLPLMAFVSSLIVITFIDFEHQIIPNRITLPGIPLALVLGSLVMRDPFMRSAPLGWEASVIGSAVGFGVFAAILYSCLYLLKKEGLGAGDVKMMAMAGALVGWKGVFLTTFAGSLTGSVFGVTLMAFYGKGRQARLPFGPFLALGCLITLFFGQEILDWYLGAGI